MVLSCIGVCCFQVSKLLIFAVYYLWHLMLISLQRAQTYHLKDINFFINCQRDEENIYTKG